MSKFSVISHSIDKVIKGINEISDLVKSTFGAKGRFVLIKRGNEYVYATKDGVTVAESVDYGNTEEGIGVDLIQNAARRTVDSDGDGTTVTTILAQKIINEAMSFIGNGYNPIILKKSIAALVDEVLYFVDAKSIPIQTEQDLINIATVSANNDEKLGKLIGSAIFKIGEYGDLKVEQQVGRELSVEYVNGYIIKRGYDNPTFLFNHKLKDIRLLNPYVVLFDQKIVSFDEIEGACELAANETRPLIIIAHAFDHNVERIIEANNKQGMTFITLQAEGIGVNRTNILDDLALLCGATVVPNMNVRNVVEALGYFESVHIKKNETVFFNGNINQTEYDNTLAYLKSLTKDNTDIGTYVDGKQRLARLLNGVGILKIGAETDVELGERMDRVEDAIKATKSALLNGYVVGGGVTFVRALKALKGFNKGSKYEKAAYTIMKKTLKEPIRILAKNAGFNSSEVVSKVILTPCQSDNKEQLECKCDKCAFHDDCGSGKICVDGKCICAVDYAYTNSKEKNVTYNNYNYGFNVLTGEYGDLIDMGIYDPTNVIKSSIKSAFSVAEIIMSTSGLSISTNYNPFENKLI